MSVNFDINTIKLNKNGDTLNIPNEDQDKIRGAFNRFINDPKLFYVSRITGWDGVAIAIVVLALGALTYLISASNFSNYSAISYSLIGIITLSLGKVIYRQYCVKKCKEHLYLAFAVIAIRPYLNANLPGTTVPTFSPSCTRKLSEHDFVVGMGYVTEDLSDDGLNEQLKQFRFHEIAKGLRTKISKNPNDFCHDDIE